MLRSLIQKLKNFSPTISTHLSTLVEKMSTLIGTVKRNASGGFQVLQSRFTAADNKIDLAENAPQPPEWVDEQSIEQAHDETPFQEQLLEAAAKRLSADYSPRGTSHELNNPAGLYMLSQARDYIVYTPPDYQLNEALPMVLVLHGCKQTNLEIRANSGFDEIADRERFIVVYPFVTGYVGLRNRNCWGWWQRYHIQSGSGEVEDVRHIIEQVQQKFSVDKSRIHITGLSSGAGMTVAALVAHGTLFASGASVAGVAYGESARAVRFNAFLSVKYHSLKKTVTLMKAQLAGKGRLAPLLVIQSKNDQTVRLQSALNLRDSWLEVKRAQKERPDPITGENQEISWEYHQFIRGNEVTPAEVLLVEQLKHGWIGGNEGEYSESRGPNISEIIWLFFKRHPR